MTSTLWRFASLCCAALLCGCGAQHDVPTTSGSRAAAVPQAGCGGTALPVSQVQGRSLASPLLGQRVAIEAIVTARAPALGGVFVQEEQADRDGDALTSEALLLITDPAALNPGQRVRAEGIVVEHGDEGASVTALSELGSLLVCASDELPAPFVIEQPPLVVEDWEALESMRVALEPPATVLEPDSLLRQGELLVGIGGRQFAATDLALPGEEALKVAAENQRARLALNSAHARPEDLRRMLGLPDRRSPWRAGTELRGVAGIFSQHGGRYGIHLQQAPAIVQAVRPASPPEIEGALRIASFNTLNLFNGDGKGGSFPTARGASSRAEWQRQLDKHVAVLSALQADIVALVELENDGAGGDSAEAQLLQALNRALGKAGDYVAVAPPAAPLGSDDIRVGLIYRKSRVEPVGAALAMLGEAAAPQSRPPLLQSFVERRSKQQFAVVANHFKSKGGCAEAAPGDHDREDGQGCYNATRVETARALANWLEERLGPPDQTAVLLLGDFNAYAREDPLRLLAERGYARVRVAEPDYSFVYDGVAGSLDHALASAQLRQHLGSAAVWHINSDESSVFDYQADDSARSALRGLYRPDPFRSSDHDPLLLGLNFPEPPAPRKSR